MTNYNDQMYFTETNGTNKYIFELFTKFVTFKLEFNIRIPLSLILYLQLNYYVVAYNVKSDASMHILCDCVIVARLSQEILHAYWKQMQCLPRSVYFSCGIYKQENTVHWYYATLQDVGVSYGTMPETQFRNYWSRKSYNIRFVTFELNLQLTYTNLSLLCLHITSLLKTKFKHFTVISESLSALWRIRQLELQ